MMNKTEEKLFESYWSS